MKKILSLLLLAFLLTGCAASTPAGSEYSADDINFAEMIKDAQEPEIGLMKSWAGVSSSTHAGHMMDGMLSAAEITELRGSKSPAFDLLFLQGMIKHHEGAIEMAEAVTSSKNQEVADLAALIIDAQLKEIALMKELISNL